MSKNIIRKIPAILIMIVIFTLSSLHGDNEFLNAFELNDKLKHIIAYFTLGTFLCLWIPREKWLAKPLFWGALVVITGTVFGILDEFHQSFVPGRSGNDIGDIIANFIGSLISPFVYFAVIYYQRRRHTEHPPEPTP
ncbi:MAG: VanZ family protein [Chitinivibrionia bacterium]|nr:VanZ family protein [Chitinivibrionia bacterium]